MTWKSLHIFVYTHTHTHGKGTRDQAANTHWITEKQGNSRKNIYFCFTDYAKAFDCSKQQTVENS